MHLYDSFHSYKYDQVYLGVSKLIPRLNIVSFTLSVPFNKKILAHSINFKHFCQRFKNIMPNKKVINSAINAPFALKNY